MDGWIDRFFLVQESELQQSDKGGKYLGLSNAQQARLSPELTVPAGYSAINQ